MGWMPAFAGMTGRERKNKKAASTGRLFGTNRGRLSGLLDLILYSQLLRFQLPDHHIARGGTADLIVDLLRERGVLRAQCVEMRLFSVSVAAGMYHSEVSHFW
jgi:hypothetical protein